jgi:hypothetical protein
MIKMKELKEKLIENLKGYSFKELEEILNKQNEPEVREAIMNAMEKYHTIQFNEWLERI